MKVVISKQEKPQKEYPYLAIHKDDLNRQDPMIVMFLSPDFGNLLIKNKEQPTTYFDTREWPECDYAVFQGQLTLSN